MVNEDAWRPGHGLNPGRGRSRGVRRAEAPRASNWSRALAAPLTTASPKDGLEPAFQGLAGVRTAQHGILDGLRLCTGVPLFQRTSDQGSSDPDCPALYVSPLHPISFSSSPAGYKEGPSCVGAAAVAEGRGKVHSSQRPFVSPIELTALPSSTASTAGPRYPAARSRAAASAWARRIARPKCAKSLPSASCLLLLHTRMRQLCGCTPLH